jgi:hypothetical protein
MNAINTITNNAIATELIPMGRGKAGSFARAIAFASREQRHALGRAVYAAQLQNGQYRPIVRDAIELLVPKSARAFVEAMIPPNGGISKDKFAAFCTAVHNFVQAKNKSLKGEKMFVYGIIKAVAEEAAAHETVIETEGLRRAA